VSDFLTDVCGHLALPNEMQTSENFPREACVIMHPDKNNDGWWKADDLINQVVERAIPIFEACFPECQPYLHLIMHQATLPFHLMHLSLSI